MNLPEQSGWYRCKSHGDRPRIVYVVVEEWSMFLTDYFHDSPWPSSKTYMAFRYEPNAGDWRGAMDGGAASFRDFELIEAAL